MGESPETSTRSAEAFGRPPLPAAAFGGPSGAVPVPEASSRSAADVRTVENVSAALRSTPRRNRPRRGSIQTVTAHSSRPTSPPRAAGQSPVDDVPAEREASMDSTAIINWLLKTSPSARQTD
jgi:hypothetical protein